MIFLGHGPGLHLPFQEIGCWAGRGEFRDERGNEEAYVHHGRQREDRWKEVEGGTG